MDTPLLCVIDSPIERARLRRLKPKHAELISSLAFNLTLRPYIVEVLTTIRVGPEAHCPPRHRRSF
jgi:hypothetical protein